MRDLATLKTAGQQRVAVLVTDIGEVLARHTDARGSGLLQTIHKVPFLFRHRTLLMSSTYVLVVFSGDGQVNFSPFGDVVDLLGATTS